jgi:mannosyltransferase OCH1-like enzyme
MTIKISEKFPLIHQIAFTDLPELYRANENSITLIQQFGLENYRLWKLDDTRDFIKEFYPREIVLTFDRLKPYSYKSDLARFCIINHFGGIYLDLSVNDLKYFDAKDFDMILFRDLNSTRTSWKVATSFFYSKSRSPILEDSIRQCVENYKSKYYGWDSHFPTGPSVLGRSVSKFGPDLNILVGQYYWLRRRRNKYVLPENNVVGRHKVGGAFLGGHSGLSGGNNYNEMWTKRDIYED